jgi:hypothetical protein
MTGLYREKKQATYPPHNKHENGMAFSAAGSAEERQHCIRKGGRLFICCAIPVLASEVLSIGYE